MDKASQKMTTDLVHKRHFNKSELIEITRTFQASVERVWMAWSNPEMMKQWMGPKDFTCPMAKLDFRIGGKFIFAMKDSKGKLTYSTGIYEQILLHEKIIMTDQFSDKEGNVISAKEAGIATEGERAGKWPKTCFVTVKFEKLGSEETRMSLIHEGIPAAACAECNRGWSESFDKMQKLVEII